MGGFNDSTGRDREHCNRLCAYLKGCGGINAFVLVRNGANVRFDMSFQEMLTQYQDMFGDQFFESLIIVVTRIEGFIKKNYEKNNQEEVMRRDICEKFELGNLKIPVIPIGFEDYDDSLRAFVKAIPSKRREIEAIKSPIDDLKAQHATLQKKMMHEKMLFEKPMLDMHAEKKKINQRLAEEGFEEVIEKQDIQIKHLNIQESAAEVHIHVGKVLKAASIVAAGVATGGVGAVALTSTLAKSLKNFEIDLSFSERAEEKKTTKFLSDQGRVLFIEAKYTVESRTVGCMCWKTTELLLTGSLKVTYMEGEDIEGIAQLYALTAKNVASSIEHIVAVVAKENED